MNEVIKQHQMIVAEALNFGMVGGITGSVNAKLKGIAGAIGEWARGRIRPEVKIPLISYNVLIKDLAGARYSDVSGTKITVPRGLKDSLNGYAEALFDALVKVENIEEEVLKPFSVWLSLRIASPDTLASAATVTDLKNFKEQDIEGTRAFLAKFVDPTGRVDTLPLQDVYGSIGVIKPTWDNANSLVTRYLETNPTRIVKLVKEIADKIDRVIDLIDSGKDEGSAKLSAQSAVIMSGICMNMSMAIDLYGNLGILIRELIVACDHQIKELKRPLEDSARLSMAKESFVAAHEPVFLFSGIKIPHKFVYDQLGWKSPEDIDISELDWVFEHIQRDPLVGDGQRDWMETKVGAIRIGGRLYPVSGLNLLASAQSGNQGTVECLIITTEEIVKTFTGQATHEFVTAY